MTNDGTNTLTYDANGNLTNDGVNSYTWDRANRLLSHGGLSYAYDGLGNRVSQDNGSVVTKYLLDTQPGLAVVLRESDGTNTNHYVHAPRGIHAQYDGSAWEYMMQDGLNSVRGLVDASAAVQQSVNYSEYGEPDTSLTGFAFTGEQRDTNGLQYHRARYYDPELGVWASLDPLEMGNRYAYVYDNPTNLVDPEGAAAVAIATGIALGCASNPACVYGVGATVTAMGWYALGGPNQLAGFFEDISAGFQSVISGIMGPAPLSAHDQALFAYYAAQAECDMQFPFSPDANSRCVASLYPQYLPEGVSVPLDSVLNPPMPSPQFPNGVDPKRLSRICNSGICGVLLFELLRRLIRNSDRADDNTQPRDRVNQAQFIYKLGNRVKDLALHRVRDYETGHSFMIEPPASSFFTYEVETLIEAGYIVLFDGGATAMNIWREQPYIEPNSNSTVIFPEGHVTVYHSSFEYWRGWHEADLANYNTPAVSPQLLAFYNLRYQGE